MSETALSAISEGTSDKIQEKLFEASQIEFLEVLQKDLLEDHQKEFLEQFKTIKTEELPYKIVRIASKEKFQKEHV